MGPFDRLGTSKSHLPLTLDGPALPADGGAAFGAVPREKNFEPQGCGVSPPEELKITVTISWDDSNY